MGKNSEVNEVYDYPKVLEKEDWVFQSGNNKGKLGFVGLRDVKNLIKNES